MSAKISFNCLLILPVLLLMLVTGLVSVLPVLAIGNGSISVSPTIDEYKPDEPLTKGWIIEKLNPGDQVRRKVLISNSTDEEKKIVLSEEDYYAGDQGAYSYTDKEELKNLGTWLKLDTTNITVPAQKATEIGFSINVPKDTKPGEYSGVVAMQEVAKSSNNDAISFVSRVSTRIYVTVPGDLQTGVKFNEFKFITPDSTYTDTQKYKDFLRANYNLPSDNIFLSLNYTNTGNIFERLRGNIEVTNPDGVVTTTGFNRDLGYGEINISVPYFLLGTSKWEKPGTYKARYIFTNEPLIASNKTNVKNTSPAQTVETEFTITQDMINQIKTDLARSKKEVNDPETYKQTNFKDNSFVVSNAIDKVISEDAKKSEDKFVGYIFAVAIIIVLLLLVIVYLINKDRSKSKQEITASSLKDPLNTMTPAEKADVVADIAPDLKIADLAEDKIKIKKPKVPAKPKN